MYSYAKIISKYGMTGQIDDAIMVLVKGILFSWTYTIYRAQLDIRDIYFMHCITIMMKTKHFLKLIIVHCF